jgi:hypothetical protein
LSGGSSSLVAPAVGGRAGDADADLGSARGDTRIALVPVRETRGNRRRGGASPVVETNGDCGTGAEVGVVASVRSAVLAAGSEHAGGLVDGVGTEGVATLAKSVAERALVASTVGSRRCGGEHTRELSSTSVWGAR